MAPIIGTSPLGDIERPAALRPAAPAEGWVDAVVPPPQPARPPDVAGGRSAAALDLPPLLDVLEEHGACTPARSGRRGRYMGPVELWLGTGRAALGEHDRAVADLRTRWPSRVRNGAPRFAVQSGRRARHRARRSDARPGDAAEAAALAAETCAARSPGPRHGSRGWPPRRRGSTAGSPDPGPLSAVSSRSPALVARGLTNKQIATELYLSERTAQNHVQHILTKLGMSNRTQIAVWFNDR